MKILIFLLVQVATAAPVRELKLKPKDVGTINTAIGYSTVVQFPEKPLNVVLGDQSSFRVEFIKDSITIKPAVNGAKSNLFVFTENERFNLTVRSGSQSSVDYVVRVRRVYSDPEKVSQINAYRTQGNLRFHIFRQTKRNGNTFFDFGIENLGKKTIRFAPELFRVTKYGRPLSIGSLYLSKDSVSAKSVSHGSIMLPGSVDSSGLGIWIGLADRNPANFVFGIQRNTNRRH